LPRGPRAVVGYGRRGSDALLLPELYKIETPLWFRANTGAIYTSGLGEALNALDWQKITHTTPNAKFF
jgi:hypothetical protein